MHDLSSIFTWEFNFKIGSGELYCYPSWIIQYRIFIFILPDIYSMIKMNWIDWTSRDLNFAWNLFLSSKEAEFFQASVSSAWKNRNIYTFLYKCKNSLQLPLIWRFCIHKEVYKWLIAFQEAIPFITVMHNNSEGNLWRQTTWIWLIVLPLFYIYSVKQE